MEVSIKTLMLRSLLILISCFAIVLFSINQIINMAKPKMTMLNSPENTYNQVYPITLQIASKPDQDYKNFMATLSAKFPNQPIAGRLNISPDIEALPPSEQGIAIRFNLLEKSIEFLQNELTRIVESQSEQLIYKPWFYFWSFLTWMGSVIIGRVLEHLADKFNTKYLGDKAQI